MQETKSKIYQEERYIEGLLQNDRRIIKRIYDENFKSVANTICANRGTEAEAWDIFQEAVLIIYSKASKKNLILTSKFSTFLHAICWRLWLKELRKKRTGVVISDDLLEYNNITDENELLESSRMVLREKLYRKKFEELGDACKKLLRLYFNKLPMNEISRRMGYSVSFSTQKAFRCRKKLISMIKADDSYKELRNDQ